MNAIEIYNNNNNIYTKNYTNDKKTSSSNDLPTTVAITLISLISIGAASIQSNIPAPPTFFSDGSLNKTKREEFDFNYANYSVIINLEDLNTKEEAATMSDVSQKDLIEQERHLLSEVDKKVSRISEDIKSTNQNILKLTESISDINTKLTSLTTQVDNLPDKLKASKWDYFIEKIFVPVVVACVTAGIIYFFGFN